MGPYELGVTNALWQKAFTPEWGATRRQAGGKVKRCVTVFDVLIPLNVTLLSEPTRAPNGSLQASKTLASPQRNTMLLKAGRA